MGRRGDDGGTGTTRRECVAGGEAARGQKAGNAPEERQRQQQDPPQRGSFDYMYRKQLGEGQREGGRQTRRPRRWK